MENLNTDLSHADLADLFAEVGRRLALVGDVAAHAGSKGHEAVGGLQLLDAREVAEICKIPVAAVYEAARRKQLGSVRASAKSRSGRAVRFTRAQVEAFIADRSVAAGAAGSSRMLT